MRRSRRAGGVLKRRLTSHGNSSRIPNAIFMSKVREQNDGCWKWVGTLTRTPTGSYGSMSVNGRSVAAHRMSWQLFRGTIPDGLQIDHLCRNTRCVNPLHLEPVTQRENILRGVGFAAVNARKTHCKRGHEFSPENTITQASGRACRTCVYAARRRRREQAA